MFFVFGPAGQMFRGSSEQLAQVSPVSALRRSQALFSDNAEVLDSPQPPPQSPLPHAAQGPVAAPTAQTQGAVAAYVQTAVGPQPPRQPLSKVRDVMSTDPVSISPDSVVQAAWQQLAAQHLGQAPVVNVQGQVVGMLLRAHMVPLELWSQLDDVQQARTLAQRRVQEVMISPGPTVAAEAPLRQVAQVLIDTDLPGLPVTDITGQLEGFISRTDILRALAVDPPLDIWSGPRPDLSAERRLHRR